MTDDYYQWVHEKDYGANGTGEIIVGLVLLVVGVVNVIIELFRKGD